MKDILTKEELNRLPENSLVRRVCEGRSRSIVQNVEKIIEAKVNHKIDTEVSTIRNGG